MSNLDNITQNDLGIRAQRSSNLSSEHDNGADWSRASSHNRRLHDKALVNSTRTELAIHAEIAGTVTPLQFVWNAVFQTVCVAIAFLFGVFSIFAYHSQKVGNNQSLNAKQLAVITVCLTSNSSEIVGTCSDILPKLSASFAEIAARSFGEQSLGGTSVWPWRTSYASYAWEVEDPTGMIVMIVVPILCASIGLYAASRIYLERFSR